MRFLVLLFCLFHVQSALAFSNSEYNILGFSKDGRHFVFEEFYIFDGNGVPEATLYVIDTEDDTWVKGTPFLAIKTEDDVYDGPLEGLSVNQLRKLVTKEAQSQASETLKKIGPLSAGTTIVRNLPHDFTTDGKSARFPLFKFVNRTTLRDDEEVWNLKLEISSFPNKAYCSDLLDDTKGLKLSLTNEQTGDKRIISEDKEVPKSRDCPIDYWIEEIVVYTAASNVRVIAIIIRYSIPGFEGSDGRFMAVTSRVKY